MISAIAAIGKNRELGTKNQLSWRISDDFKRVKELTMGHPLIMGRKTYESIGRPLPGRTNIVITRDQDYTAEGCVVVTSIESAIEEARKVEDKEIFIFGGAEIYKLALPFTDHLYLTLIDDEDPSADTHFPDYSAEFKETVRHGVREQNELKYEWVEFEKVK
ncbi:dihydrofolate reductase [Candidatus Nomurabacteria bacterium]|nr:dihydrofolate reductase [Candidatus Nomurabacteria bacterium]